MRPPIERIRWRSGGLALIYSVNFTGPLDITVSSQWSGPCACSARQCPMIALSSVKFSLKHEQCDRLIRNSSLKLKRERLPCSNLLAQPFFVIFKRDQDRGDLLVGVPSHSLNRKVRCASNGVQVVGQLHWWWLHFVERSLLLLITVHAPEKSRTWVVHTALRLSKPFRCFLLTNFERDSPALRPEESDRNSEDLLPFRRALTVSFDVNKQDWWE